MGECHEFFISRRVCRGSQICVATFAVAFVWHAAQGVTEYLGGGIGVPWSLRALAAVTHGLVAFYFAWGLVRSARPVVRIGEREVEWGSPFYLSGRRHGVRLDEIRSIGWRSPRRIGLDLGPSGGIEMRVAQLD
jgi:hypothetical protein